MKLKLPFLLGITIAGVEAYWSNGWDGQLTFICPHKGDNYQAIKRIVSEHNNHHEDRRWHFECGDVPKNGKCNWNGQWLNGFDGDLNYVLPGNGYLIGVHSYHNSHHEDRRWKFAYCEMPSGFEDCKWTGYANGWDGYMNYKVPQARVIHGAYSYHHNRHEDRKWKFLECGIKKCEVMSMKILSKPPATVKGTRVLDVKFNRNCSPNPRKTNFKYVSSIEDRTTISHMEKFDFEYSSEFTVKAGAAWLGGDITSKVGFKAGYGTSIENTRSLAVSETIWTGTEDTISPYSAGLGLALATEYEYLGTSVPVEYTIKCGSETYTERKTVQIKKHTYQASTTDFVEQKFGNSGNDCKSEQLQCLSKLDASNALFRSDVLTSKFKACFKGYSAYPNLQLTSTGIGKSRAGIGIYKPINEVINGKPVWKHTTNYLKLYFDKYGGWRVGVRANSGHISSASGEGAQLPTAINGKWYVSISNGWQSDSTMRLVAIPNTGSRSFDFQNDFNATYPFELEDRKDEDEEEEDSVFDGEFDSDYEHDDEDEEDLVSKLISSLREDEKNEDPKTKGNGEKDMSEEK